MSTLDLDAFRSASLNQDPFDWVIVPGFVRKLSREPINRDFPKVDLPGSFPLATLRYGAAFADFMKDIRGPAMTRAFEEKFDIDLTGRPTMVTVRGMCRATDGKIHTDSTTKVITVLIYMNSDWDNDGGRLRLLRSADDLEDMVAEVPPEEGTLLAFRNGPTAWHGHKPFEGRRRAIQLNWVTGPDVVRREGLRHAISARLKQIRHALPFA